ncbi:MAG: ankyrin repeat domain-containing protein [Lentisphaerae bacterium]|nr:ankyrin repeat domain-containing protein [Lentisphaerota bacterium]
MTMHVGHKTVDRLLVKRILPFIRFSCLALMFHSNMPLCLYAAPSDSHVELASAAEWAVITTNTTLLRALLDAGVQINEPIGNRDKTLLGTAVLNKNEQMVKVLLNNGADPERKSLNCRLIDMAFENGSTNICLLLSKRKNRKEKLIDGLPIGVLEHVFRPTGWTNVVFLIVNRSPPSAEMLVYLRESIWPAARVFPETLINQFKDDFQRPIRYTGDEKNATLFECIVEKKCDDEYKTSTIIFHQLPRRTPMEFIEAVPIVEKIVKRYGYWMCEPSH